MFQCCFFWKSPLKNIAFKGETSRDLDLYIALDFEIEEIKIDMVPGYSINLFCLLSLWERARI